jgi:hypothetical protein
MWLRSIGITSGSGMKALRSATSIGKRSAAMSSRRAETYDKTLPLPSSHRAVTLHCGLRSHAAD